MLLGLPLLLALLVAGCGGGSTLGASSLAKQADAVQSLAAEGALLGQDAADDRTTTVFLREHSSELSSAAGKLATSLDSAKTAPALRPKLLELRRLASQVQRRLDALSKPPRASTRTTARALQSAADRCKSISDSLG
jgi:hypothetical protein